MIFELPLVTIVATDANVAELGPDTATFVVSREGPTTSARDVVVTISGTATGFASRASRPRT